MPKSNANIATLNAGLFNPNFGLVLKTQKLSRYQHRSVLSSRALRTLTTV